MIQTLKRNLVGASMIMALWLAWPDQALQGEGPPPELRGKLHGILAVDTRSGLGESVAIDGEHIANLLRSGIPRDRLDLVMITGKDLTADRILQTFKDIKVDSSDAMFFYYSGHGAIDASKGHWMALQQLDTKPLVRGDLKKAMEDKKPGLVVIMTDCCSARLKLPGKKRKIIPEPGEAKELNPVLRCLFFQHRGVVDITAADDGTLALGDEHEGGLFTRTVYKVLSSPLAELDVNHDGFVSWQEVFPRLQAETPKDFGPLARQARSNGEKVDQTTQRPRALALPGGSGGNAGGVVTLVNPSNENVRYQFRWKGDDKWETGAVPANGKRTHAPPAGKPPGTGMEIKLENGESDILQVGKSYKCTNDMPKKGDK